MSCKIYVGNLSDQITENDLEQLFRPYGRVAGVEVITELGGRGTGFGFVEMYNADAARKAVAELNGRRVRDLALIVNEATVEEEVVGPRSGGFGDQDFN